VSQFFDDTGGDGFVATRDPDEDGCSQVDAISGGDLSDGETAEFDIDRTRTGARASNLVRGHYGPISRLPATAPTDAIGSPLPGRRPRRVAGGRPERGAIGPGTAVTVPGTSDAATLASGRIARQRALVLDPNLHRTLPPR
jgi:cold shock CspA family protein